MALVLLAWVDIAVKIAEDFLCKLANVGSQEHCCHSVFIAVISAT